MKKLLIIIILAIGVGYVNAQPSPPKGLKWKTVHELSDEFNYWDNAKWSKSLWNYEAPVNMKRKNSGVKDGMLWIKATLGKDTSRWFESCRVMSKEQIGFPMYTECSMKASYISAFSTYWLNNGNSGSRDEIDICEHNTKPSYQGQEDRPYQMYAQYFIVVNNDTERAHATRKDTRSISKDNPAYGKMWHEDFQTLGCYWKDEHNVIFYINGEESGSVTSTRKFSRELNIIWDLWTSVHSWTGGIADKSELSNDEINTMYVDWIHTYKLVKCK